jgi:hypothetical protein
MSAVDKESLGDEEWTAVKEAIDEALSQADRFRMEEGQLLEADMQKRIGLILGLLESVGPFEQARIRNCGKRFERNSSELSPPGPEWKTSTRTASNRRSSGTLKGWTSRKKRSAEKTLRLLLETERERIKRGKLDSSPRRSAERSTRWDPKPVMPKFSRSSSG